ncbi:MAG: MFS transporter [Alphaproteobacteria bacterium]|nr:MAG: MFS transporter [Alphaproteobacteria bacterium]
MPAKHLHKQFSKAFPGLVPWVIWVFAILFYMYQVILRISASVFADDWVTTYGIGMNELGMLSGVFYYAYGGMQISSGRLMDKWGVRKMLTFAALMCAFGSYIMALAPTYTIAMIGRFCVGVGSSCGYLGCLKIATLWFSPRQTGLIVGLSFSFGMIGGVLGNTPLALLNQHMHWQDIQMYFVWVGIGIAGLVWVGIRSPNKHDLITKLRTRTAPARATPTKKKNTSLVHSLMIIAKTPQAWVMAICGMLMYVPIAAFTDLWGISYFQTTLGISETEASAINSLTFLGIVCSGPIYAMLSNHLRSHKKTMRISAVCLCFAFGGILIAPILPSTLVGFLSFLFGFFFGGEILCYVAVVSLFSRSISGLASGFTNTVVNLSGIIFQPLVGYILAALIEGSTPTSSTYQIALLPVFGCIVLSVVLTFFMIETFPPKKKIAESRHHTIAETQNPDKSKL